MDRVIPSTRQERERLRRLAHDYVSDKALQPPVPLSDLEELATALIKAYQLDEGLRDWLMVELHNGV